MMNRLAACSCRWLVMIAAFAFSLPLEADDPNARRIEFNRDIRPILSDKCFTCHGPDSAKRQAGLRLDRSEEALAERDGSRALVPHDLSKSEAYRRIVSRDPDEQMPPAKSGDPLSEKEAALIRQWIEQGAAYQPHWSFISPRAVVPPGDERSEANRPGATSPIDLFVRDRLSRENLKPSPEADKNSLIRRVTFDLIGLPPTPEEVDHFVDDSSPDAFEKLVDRLLASPRYGERLATIWLDAARYADTNGYQTDGPRVMWRWRDWVIDAFNRNQPFDEFTVDQLAGDLLESSTSSSAPNLLPSETKGEGAGSPAIANDRLIATGFNRNHRGNAEGGIIPEEFRVEYVVDRVETTSTVWLGLTIGCARCHDHKYDPISQREFYQLFDFFNQIPEPGKYIRNSNSMPYLPAPTADQLLKLKALEREVDVARVAWETLAPAVNDGLKRLALKVAGQQQIVDWSYREGLDSHIAFDGNSLVEWALNPPASVQKDDARRANSPSYRERETVWQDGDAQFVSGRIGQAAEFDGRRWLDAGDVGDFGEDESFAISLWVKPRGRKAMTILARMDHENSSRGYELRIEESGRLQALFAGRILDDLIRLETDEPLPTDRWSHVFVAYDGSSAARGVSIRLNGQRVKTTVITDLLSNPIRVKLPLIVGAGGSAKPFVGQLDELRFYRGRLTDEVAMSLSAGESLSEIVSGKLGNIPTPAQLAKLREFYLDQHAPEVERRARQNVLDAAARYEAYLATIPTTMVMQDVPGLRETRILTRGEYNKPGEPVRMGVPAALPPLGDQKPLDRLALARWLVSPEHPLTSRVTVNRLWQMVFGIGLVKTSEDFGTQGELPSHPELLDWLAIEFGGSANRASRFDIKRTLRQLVTSATYRQSSRVDQILLAKDPENRLLARGPRFRLTAEMIRDAALASSGLLVESIGGPSVKPYQPPGLWEELSAEAVPGPFSVYVQDHGASLYRRSLYTYQKRTVTTPGMAIFDASSRDFCRVKLPRTNTPLQALNLMNDITYLEAARVLAEHAMRDGGASTESRITWAFRRVLSRSPSDSELSVLLLGFNRRSGQFEKQATLARNLLGTGESTVEGTLAAHELAAFTTVTSAILSLDEAVNRN